MAQQHNRPPRHEAADRPPVVGAILELSSEFDRGVLRGILRYANAVTDWRLVVYRWEKLQTADVWRACDGLIVHGADHPVSSSPSMVRRCIVVTGNPTPAAIRVWTNDRRLGALAAEHLLARGYERFIFIGNRAIPTFRNREAGFRSLLESKGRRCRVIHQWSVPQADSDPDAWLRGVLAAFRHVGLPLAVGVATPVDGRRVLEVCAAGGLAVPRDVAVVSCEDESLVAESTRPALSGVDVRAEAIGYSAAAHLDTLIEDTGPIELGHVEIVEPGAVIVRGSSDAEAGGEACAARALRFIQAHALEPISVRAIARAIGVSKRTLERAFRDGLGSSPHQELLRLRLRRASEFLRQTDWPVARIAERCGYSSTMHFVNHFRHRHRLSPAQYRLARDSQRLAVVPPAPAAP